MVKMYYFKGLDTSHMYRNGKIIISVYPKGYTFPNKVPERVLQRDNKGQYIMYANKKHYCEPYVISEPNSDYIIPDEQFDNCLPF